VSDRRASLLLNKADHGLVPLLAVLDYILHHYDHLYHRLQPDFDVREICPGEADAPKKQDQELERQTLDQ
jgi:hypothetical protein